MNKYQVKVLNTGGSSYIFSSDVIIVAASMEIDSGAYFFYNKEGDVIASYPVNFTIITKM